MNRKYASYGLTSPSQCVYDPLWLLFGPNGPANSWVEIGVAHTCQYFPNWDKPGMWLYAYLSDSTYTGFVWSRDISANGTRHWLRLGRDYGLGTPAFDIYLDGGFQGYTTYGGASETHIWAGLESHVSNHHIPWESAAGLQYKRSGSWHSWGGYDGWAHFPQQMCGYWTNSHKWMAGEDNKPCTR